MSDGSSEPPSSWDEVLVMTANLCSLFSDGSCFYDALSGVSRAVHYGMSGLMEEAVATVPLTFCRSEVPRHILDELGEDTP